MSFWRNKKVLVTGGVGFIGSHLVERLVTEGAKVRVADNLENGFLENLGRIKDRIEFTKKDLRVLKDCLEASQDQEIVLNLAAKVGGIEFNREHLGTMFRDNILISTQMLEAAKLNNVERFLVVSSACVYPRHCTIPTPEEEGFKDVPEPTNEGYGWAKRMAEVQAKAYSQEFAMKIAIVRPYNTYGPRDHFDAETGHVIPALVKKVFDGEDPLIVWGDGKQSRAFLYVEDVVEGMLKAIEKYPVCDPLNLGTTEEIKIKDLVRLIIQLSGKRPRLFFDTSKPSGQPRRNCVTSKSIEKIDFEAKISLKEGLERTIDWYRNEFVREIKE